MKCRIKHSVNNLCLRMQLACFRNRTLLLYATQIVLSFMLSRYNTVWQKKSKVRRNLQARLGSSISRSHQYSRLWTGSMIWMALCSGNRRTSIDIDMKRARKQRRITRCPSMSSRRAKKSMRSFGGSEVSCAAEATARRAFGRRRGRWTLPGLFIAKVATQRASYLPTYPSLPASVCKVSQSFFRVSETLYKTLQNI